jgi:hypothetical protein
MERMQEKEGRGAVPAAILLRRPSGGRVYAAIDKMLRQA